MMARSYTMKRRAEQQADTRRRIVEAAIGLHGSVGPAASSFSLVAERAGVQRHTLYAHFPDESSLLEACSGLHLERDPLPDPEAWRSLTDMRSRICTGLGEIYRWYARNADLLGCVLRDAEHHEPTREISRRRFGPSMMAAAEVLGETLGAGQRAMLQLALSFHSWRTLRDAGLGLDAAAETMTTAVVEAR
jgi:AcrR family transcriptional regulator